VLIALWAVLATGAPLESRLVMAGYQVDWLSLAYLFPTLALNVMIAAAFWGYMCEGRRPNLYFKRRVRM
jgi:hypothetical protein